MHTKTVVLRSFNIISHVSIHMPVYQAGTSKWLMSELNNLLGRNPPQPPEMTPSTTSELEINRRKENIVMLFSYGSEMLMDR